MPTAQADCLLKCAPINAKALFCGYTKSGDETMPTIGTDPGRDKCLCSQSNIDLYNDCLQCKDSNTAESITNQFVRECKKSTSDVTLVSITSSGHASHSSIVTYAVVGMAFLVATAAFSS
ncbi:hypothetical protein BGZ54_004811 [Gamsiella multidivaricata]|nr:hypothetical protein BGZ54_004811 [Gamsiella multidivaricata]